MMELFEKKLLGYLTLYKTPIGPNQLDPTVFYSSETGEEPKLQPGVHSQIVKDLEILASNQPSRIKNYYMVGDVCKPGSKNRKSDIKVVVELNKSLMDVDFDGLLAEEMMKLANQLSNKLATGTTRKIRYVLTIRPIDSEQYEGIYDIGKFRWFKTPSGLKTC